MLSFWSKNQLGIKIYVCRMVWGLVGYGCRLVVVVHGFGVGHSGLYIRKLSKPGVTEKLSFSGHGPTPENSYIFSSLHQCWLNCLKMFLGVTPMFRTTFDVL